MMSIIIKDSDNSKVPRGNCLIETQTDSSGIDLIIILSAVK